MARILILLVLLLAAPIQAADGVPFSASSIRSVGAGFVEIIGPGKIMVNGEVFPYEQIIYISISNIDSISSVGEGIDGCMLHYSSEGYTENISLIDQSCNDALEVIKEAED